MKATNKNEYISDLSIKMKNVCQIDKNLYRQYNVKRGLRNPDHTGVLVGLTNIGDVVGYKKENDQIIPIEGDLYYRGISIKDIVKGTQKDKRHGFDEVSYLLLTGEMPSMDKLKCFSTLISRRRELPLAFRKNILNQGTGKNVMNVIARAVLELYSYDKNPEDRSEENIARQTLDLLAKFPTIIAYSYNAIKHVHYKKTLSIRHPKKNLSTAENFLYMLKGDKFTALEADLLDLCLIIHAEHGGGNNSTFTVRVVSSAGTDSYSAISAAISSLKGIYHGGANLKVLEMMDNIKDNVKDKTDKDELADYLMKILKKEVYDGFGKIYGFGHAVYTLSDPRCVLLRERARALAIEKDKLDEYELYRAVEDLAPKVFGEFKGGKKNKILSANVDFYSGFVYSCIGIPKELFTPIFAMGRLPGWCAHRLEEANMTSKRIIRPAYKNVCEKQRYIPITERNNMPNKN
ncbi:MAG: citrate synthase [Candidatus Marinimicrobia bacterium]|nr:citrate synthase [Candidatus Neomarinimicrobiota bacterium]